MDKIFLLSIIIVGLNVRKILTQPGLKCEWDRASFGIPTSTKTLPGFCTGSRQHVLSGDFNGDGRMDILCHDSKNGNNWIYYGANNGFSVVGYGKPTSWCSHSGASLYIGDFNGDSRDDILCHDGNGHVFIEYADKFGHFTTGWHTALNYCECDECSLFIGDFNGDKKSDLLCHGGKDGKTWIVYATAKGNFQDARVWYKPLNWCHGWNQKLYVGNFNGDSRSDMLCHDDVTGVTYTVNANGAGSFDETGHHSTTVRWWCIAQGCSLSVARVSKDPTDDLVCHCKSPSTEALSIHFPAELGSFRQWAAADSWCKKTTEMLVIGPLKPGHCASLVCIDKVTGQYSIA